MSIIANEKLTSDVFGAVWLAALILTYEYIEINKVNGIVLLKQTDIQRLAQRICVKEVQSARVSQWCNGDHANNSYNYLRAVNEKRRVTMIGEFHGVKEYPNHLLDFNVHVFSVIDKNDTITYEALLDWYFSSYSKNSQYVDIIESSLAQELIKDSSTNKNELQEDEIKHKLNEYLESLGWITQIAMGKVHGIDIDASRGNERWIIEVKGCGSRSAMRVNYFLAMLGEILQRMDDPIAKYSIALPDMKQYRGLWERLPKQAKVRTSVSILFVKEDGTVEEVF
jgi:hypothetical protein